MLEFNNKLLSLVFLEFPSVILLSFIRIYHKKFLLPSLVWKKTTSCAQLVKQWLFGHSKTGGLSTSLLPAEIGQFLEFSLTENMSGGNYDEAIEEVAEGDGVNQYQEGLDPQFIL